MAESLGAAGFDVERLRRQVSAASAWGTCTVGEAVAGDGSRESTVKLSCERGNTQCSYLARIPARID